MGCPTDDEGDGAQVVQRARDLLDQRAFQDAVEALLPWLKEHQTDVNALEVLGAAHAGLGNWDAAEAASRHVLEVCPESARAWSNWGTALRKLGRLGKAREAQRRAQEIDPTNDRAKAEMRKLDQQGLAAGTSSEGKSDGPLGVGPATLSLDELQPVFCLDCHGRIPHAESDRNGGLCQACITRRFAEAEARRRAEEEARQAAEAARAEQARATYEKNTGKGICQGCGSHNISERSEKQSGGAQETACCLGGCFFWPLLLLVPFLGFKTRFRRCNACGHEWRI